MEEDLVTLAGLVDQLLVQGSILTKNNMSVTR